MINWMLKSRFAANRAEFYRELAEAFEDGVKISKLFMDNAQYFDQRNNPMGQVYHHLYEQLSENPTLSGALGTVVPVEDMMLLASIDGGSDKERAEGFRNIADRVTAMNRMKAKVVKAIAAPAIIFPIMLIFLIVMGVWVVPEQITILPYENWKPHEKSLYWVSYALVHYWYVMLGAGFTAMFFYVRSFPNWKGPAREAFKRIPVVGLPHRLHSDFTCANFVSGLARQLEANTDLISALDIQAEKATPFLAWHISEIQTNLLEAPKEPAAAFDTGLFSEELHRRLVMAAQRRDKNFVSGLVRLGTESIENVEKVVEKSSGQLNKLVMVFGFLLIAYTYGTYLSIQFTTQRYMKEQAALQDLEAR